MSVLLLCAESATPPHRSRASSWRSEPPRGRSSCGHVRRAVARLQPAALALLRASHRVYGYQLEKRHCHERSVALPCGMHVVEGASLKTAAKMIPEE